MVEPQHDLNVGYVARIMKNFGLGELYMVNPRYNEEEAVRFAVHGKDVLEGVRVVSMNALRSKFDLLVGTTAIRATSRLNILREDISPEQLASILSNTIPGRDTCLILGRESSGLTNSELAMCDLVTVVDTRTEYQTLNISHALGILLYEISRVIPLYSKQASSISHAAGKKKIESASGNEIRLLLKYIVKSAKESNYDIHKLPLLKLAFQKSLAKASPTSKDVMLMVSLFRKTTVALKRARYPEKRISKKKY